MSKRARDEPSPPLTSAYFRRGGLRHVRPYLHLFETFVKGRWLNRDLLDVYAEEFCGKTREYYAAALADGRIRVSGERASADTRLKHGQKLQHMVHRHEPPVLDAVIEALPNPCAAAYMATKAAVVAAPRAGAEGDNASGEDVHSAWSDGEGAADSGETVRCAPLEVPLAVKLLAVNKPPSIPVHPCGAYHRNSLLNILAHADGSDGAGATPTQRAVEGVPAGTAQQQHKNKKKRGGDGGDGGTKQPGSTLHLIHRLDRLTSGLLLLATDAATASEVGKQMSSRRVRKSYLARVRGRFPVGPARGGEEAGSVAAAWSVSGLPAALLQSVGAMGGELRWLRACGEGKGEGEGHEDGQSAMAAAGAGGEGAGPWLLVSCPLRCKSAKDGVHECHAEGKASQTLVRLVREADGGASSVVECRPLTGRTHQIRLHLQLAGFSIANDPCYGGELGFGSGEGRAGGADEGAWPGAGLFARSTKAAVARDQGFVTGSFKEAPVADEQQRADVMAHCPHCRVSEAERAAEDARHCFGIWLHALTYDGPGWSFRAPPPPWA